MNTKPLIVLEGGEGSGKSTLLRSMKESFPGMICTREPGGTPYAEKIRTLIFDNEHGSSACAETMFGLFWAARADHLHRLVLPKLRDGVMVASDRFDASTFAYQICAQGGRQLANLFWTTRSHYLPSDLRVFYILLDLDPRIGRERIQARLTVEELNHFDVRPTEFHYKLRAGYHEFLREVDAGHEIIDASKPFEQVFAQVVDIIEHLN